MKKLVLLTALAGSVLAASSAYAKPNPDLSETRLGASLSLAPEGPALSPLIRLTHAHCFRETIESRGGNGASGPGGLTGNGLVIFENGYYDYTAPTVAGCRDLIITYCNNNWLYDFAEGYAYNGVVVHGGVPAWRQENRYNEADWLPAIPIFRGQFTVMCP